MELRQELHKVAKLRSEVQELAKKAEQLEAINRQLLTKIAQFERIQEAEAIICRSSEMEGGNDRYKAYDVQDFLTKRASLAKESQGFLKEASKLVDFMGSGQIRSSFASEEPDHDGRRNPEEDLNDLLERRLNY